MSINFQKEIDELDKADIVVVGGGTAGTAAAVSAARCGNSVILVEESAQLGGMATLGSVTKFCNIGNFTGFYKEILSDVLLDFDRNKDYSDEFPQFNPFILRYVLMNKAHNEGVKIYFHCKFIASVCVGNKIKGIVVSTKEGLKTIGAGRIIDCTGDAAAAIDCGAPYKTGRDSDGLTQPGTMMFQMIDTGKPVKKFLPEGCYEYKTVEDLPQGRILRWEEDGTVIVNMTRIKGNGAKTSDIFNLEYEGMKQAFSVAHYLQENGYENYAVSAIAAQTGIRETNRIVGEYVLTEDDLRKSRKFDDYIAKTNYQIDIHSPSGNSDMQAEMLNTYDIPYRCLIPENTENLLVAGRCISASHIALSSVRVMPTCFAMGQAAGIAASISLARDTDVRNISIDELHDKMKSQGIEYKS